MSEGIPKSARDALAKQTVAEPHLSPDLLNAYVEQALSEAEKVQVTAHLACCRDCREVVFLASAATQELEPALVAAAAPRNVLQPAVAAARAEQLQGCAVLQPRPKQPKMWWKWALPLTAVVVVGATILVERDRIADRLNPPPTEMAMKQKAAEAQPSSTAVAPPKVDSQTRSNAVSLNSETAQGKPRSDAAKKDPRAEQDRLDKQEADMRDRRAQTEIASNLENAPSKTVAGNAITAQRVPSSPPAPAAAAQSAEVASAAPAVQGANGGNDLTYVSPDVKTQAMAKSLAADQAGALTTLEMARRPSPANTRWRISRDGHVEHTVGPSTWERVMSAEPVTFRVVATVGNNVWAGGSDGALFHSSDGGHAWSRVALAGEQGAITSIHFDTAKQGSLTSDSGATWTTSDGGQTWGRANSQ